jgi:hypothetical protein
MQRTSIEFRKFAVASRKRLDRICCGNTQREDLPNFFFFWTFGIFNLSPVASLTDSTIHPNWRLSFDTRSNKHHVKLTDRQSNQRVDQMRIMP